MLGYVQVEVGAQALGLALVLVAERGDVELALSPPRGRRSGQRLISGDRAGQPVTCCWRSVAGAEAWPLLAQPLLALCALVLARSAACRRCGRRRSAIAAVVLGDLA